MAEVAHVSLPSQQGTGLQAPLASCFQDPQHLAAVADPSLLHDSVQHYSPANHHKMRHINNPILTLERYKVSRLKMDTFSSAPTSPKILNIQFRTR